jgi:UPF0755 protein
MKNPRILTLTGYVLLTLLVATLLAGRYLLSAMLSAAERPLLLAAPESVTVVTGQTAIRLIRQLESAGRIKDGWLLRLFLRWRGVANRVQAGEYRIEPGMTALDMLSLMESGRVVRHRLRLIEGWRFTEVRAALARASPLRQESNGLSDEAVMARLGEAGRSPEGMFYPDTYFYTRGDSDFDVLQRALRRMREALDLAWASRDSASQVLKAPYEALILASIVEKETGDASERPLIAGVFTRRLASGMRLQTDPTVIFGLGSAFDGNLRRRDLETDGPFNTYTRAGLPPTPIALVGGAALQAALNPAGGKALYFVAKGDGTHVFSDSYSAHLKQVQRYQLRRSGTENRAQPVSPASIPAPSTP